MFLLTGLTAVSAVEMKTTSGDIIYVHPGESIQDAIDAANSGDTVFVYSGTYNEYDILIEKNDIRIIGENRDTTIVDSNFNAQKATFNIFQVSNVTISGFTIINTDVSLGSLGGGIWLPGSNNCKITNNICYNHRDQAGIRLSGKHNIIANNICYSNEYGIDHSRNGKADSFNEIHDNTCYDNYRGLYLLRGDKNQVYANTLSNNKYNLQLALSDDNLISNNICESIYDNDMYLDRSDNNVIQNNICKDNGIIIYNSQSIDLIGNQVKKGIYISGTSYEELCSHYLEGNSVDGKPIVFYKDIDGSSITVPSNAKQIILSNCNNFEINGFDFSNVYTPIQLGQCSNIVINSNNINSVYGKGIALYRSDENTISNNNIANIGNEGLYLSDSKNNNIYDNSFNNNNYGIYFFGIFIDTQDEIYKAYQYNEVNNNIFEDNNFGIYFHRNCWRNNVYHNNFISNEVGVFIDPAQGNIRSSPSSENKFYDNNFRKNTYHAIETCDNTWYNTETLKGNYWEDFLWTDINPKDGISDISYQVTENKNDEYPLIYPWGVDNNPPETPTIEGPSSGKSGETYTYKLYADDPDEGDTVTYAVDWDDGEIGKWYSLQSTDGKVIASHVWTDKGEYSIKVKAKDKHGFQSEWSDPLSVSMPKNKQFINLEPGIYVDNAQKMPFPITIFVGDADIEIDAEGANRVEFYIDEELKATDYSEPYVWTWDEFSFGRHTLTVKAYDNTGNSDTDEMTVWKFF